MNLIPVNEPVLGQRELEYVSQCIETGWISSEGRFIEEFETKWAEYCCMKRGIAVSNGTAALQLALGCLGLEHGDEVIMPSFTIISCATAAIYNEATPVLVDANPRTWCMEVSQIESRITPRTRAIMPVHIYGHPVDMDAVFDIARKYNLAVVEDAAEAHGARYKGRICGGLGDISCFSFYANKIITTGEGGMVLTNDPIYAEKAYSLRNLCFNKERRFFHKDLGYNFRLTNMQAALGVAQMERIDQLVDTKKRNGRAYTERLKDIEQLKLPVEEDWAENVYWMYGVVLQEGASMDAIEFARRLRDHGVDSRPFFLGMHEQPILKDRGLFKNEHYPVTEYLARYGLYLPSGLAVTEGQIEKVCEAVHRVLS